MKEVILATHLSFFFIFIRTVLVVCSLDYGDELILIPLPPLGLLAARLDRLMDEYMGVYS
jgi:hypothetical protein